MTAAAQPQLRLSISQLSVAGIKANNEDCIGIRIPSASALNHKGVVIALSDGVSGAEAGQEASHTAIQNFLSDYYSTPDTWSVKKSAHRVLVALNRWLYGRSQQFIHQSKGYLCTLSVLILRSHTGYLMHVGDCRVYRLRSGNLECLSRDHRQIINSKKSYLARALGMNLNLDVDFQELELQVDDIFLLCSDGLYEFVSDRDMQSIIESESNWEGKAEELINAASKSDDNISCQLIRVDQLPHMDDKDWHGHLSQLPFAPYLNVGMQVDGLKLVRELHSGPRSEVFLAEEGSSGRKLVMKVASRTFEDDPHYIEHFAMEEWVGKRLRNPHIVKLENAPQQRSCLYYLTEFLSDYSLADWKREHPEPALQTLYPLLEQVCKAVTAMHRAETLHQDIKPDNFVFDDNGELKLIDFGSCYIAGIHPTINKTQGIPGTAEYSAPEYRLQQSPSTQADLFSVGVLTYALLCGQHPYGKAYGSARSATDFHKLRYTPIFEHNPLVPAWVDAAVHKMVALQAEHRYRELSEFMADLRTPNPLLSPSTTTPLLQRNPLRFWQGVSAGLAVLCCVLLYKNFY